MLLGGIFSIAAATGGKCVRIFGSFAFATKSFTLSAGMNGFGEFRFDTPEARYGELH